MTISKMYGTAVNIFLFFFPKQQWTLEKITNLSYIYPVFTIL